MVRVVLRGGHPRRCGAGQAGFGGGVDLGVTALAVLSTGEVAPNPRHLAGTGMAELGRQIQYKTARTGGRVHIADRWFPVRRRVRPVAW